MTKVTLAATFPQVVVNATTGIVEVYSGQRDAVARAAITAEEAARIAADQALADDIAAEAAAREVLDASLATVAKSGVAADVAFTPAGGISASDVQGAIEEAAAMGGGGGGEGDGDMLAATYDPQGIAADAFDRANHTGGPTGDLSVHLIDFIDPADHAAVYDNTGVYADAAFQAALDYAVSTYAHAPIIVFPVGTLRFANTIHLKHMVHLLGHGGPYERSQKSILHFDADLTGIRVHRINTGPDGFEDPTTRADGTMIVGLRIQSSGGTVGHGIWSHARVKIRDSSVHGFAENGINIVASTNSPDPDLHGNANTWLLDSVLSHINGGHGVYIQGGDTNAGTGIAVDARGNGGYGIYDFSFLGNTWIGTHTANNGQGSYFTGNNNARSVFVGPYSEGNQPGAIFAARTLSLNGLMSAGQTGGMRIGDNSEISPFKVIERKDDPEDRTIELRLGHDPSSAFQVVADGDTSHGLHFGWWNESTMAYELRHGRTGTGRVLEITSNLNTWVDDDTDEPLGRAKLILETVYVRISSGRYRKVEFATLPTQEDLHSGQRTIHDRGTLSTGTHTPQPSDGEFQVASNNGAHTIAASSSEHGGYRLVYANAEAAGTITLTGFDAVFDPDGALGHSVEGSAIEILVALDPVAKVAQVTLLVDAT
jgi:hypothetical protein